MPDLRHPIKVVARRTGLSPHVIRVWEKRYATVQPERTAGNRRLYSGADVEKLSLLKRATDGGHHIGDIAQWSAAKLARLVEEDSGRGIAGGVRSGELDRPGAFVPARPGPGPGDSPGPDAAAGGLVAGDRVGEAMQAIEAMDGPALERSLERSLVALGQMRLLTEVVAPLVCEVGQRWRAGTLKVAHEHVATAALRTFLGQVARPFAVPSSAPALLATTPLGQVHELGAILAAAAAGAHGWRVIYAGPGLPAEEIVHAAEAGKVRVVALSLVHPGDDPQLPAELARLRRMLPAAISIIVGGRSAAAYQRALQDAGAVVVGSLAELATELDRLRPGPA